MGHQTESLDTEKIWGGGESPFGISYGKMMMWFFLISDALTFSGFLVSYGFFRHRFSDIWPVAENVFTHFPFMHGHHPLLYVALMTFILIMSSVTMVLAVEAGHRMKRKSVILWLGLTIIGGLIFVGSQAWEWYHFIHGTAEGALQMADGSIAHMFGDFTLALSDGTSIAAAEAGEYFGHSHIGHHHAHVVGITGEASVHLPQALRAMGNGLALGSEEVQQFILTGDAAKEAIMSGNIIQGANLEMNEYGVPLFADFFFFITGFHGTHVFSGVVINFVIFVNVIMNTYEKRGHYEMVEKVGLYWHFVDLVWVFVFTFFYLV